jgi:hypothetical protein
MCRLWPTIPSDVPRRCILEYAGNGGAPAPQFAADEDSVLATDAARESRAASNGASTRPAEPSFNQERFDLGIATAKGTVHFIG